MSLFRRQAHSGGEHGALVQPVRLALTDCATRLTRALGEQGIGCGRLAEEEGRDRPGLSDAIDLAVRSQRGGEAQQLIIGQTGDFDTVTFEPHIRLREIQWVMSGLDVLAESPAERSEFVRRHGPYALLHAQMLRFFVLRADAVEAIIAANDLPRLEEEMKFSVRGIGGLIIDLPPAFVDGLDARKEIENWVYWPVVRTMPAPQ